MSGVVSADIVDVALLNVGADVFVSSGVVVGAGKIVAFVVACCVVNAVDVGLLSVVATEDEGVVDVSEDVMVSALFEVAADVFVVDVGSLMLVFTSAVSAEVTYVVIGSEVDVRGLLVFVTPAVAVITV